MLDNCTDCFLGLFRYLCSRKYPHTIHVFKSRYEFTHVDIWSFILPVSNTLVNKKFVFDKTKYSR